VRRLGSDFDAAYPWRFPAVLERVVDGDTFVATIDQGMRSYQSGVWIRIAAVSCPEKRGLERAKGLIAMQGLRNLLRESSDAPLIIQPLAEDSFRRWVSIVWAAGIEVNDWLVVNGLAKPWDYGREPRPCFPDDEAFPL